jgi:hypothetical protein
VFGYGQAESALFLRVPDRKLTFIFFANADTPSALAQLDYANVLRQPFGLAFVDSWIKNGNQINFDQQPEVVARDVAAHPSTMAVDQLFDEALIQAFRARMTGQGGERAVALSEVLLSVAPERFAQPDVYMLRLMSDVTSAKLAPAARRLLTTFDPGSDRRPVVAFWSGNVLERLGDTTGAMKFYTLLCDRAGFDDESMKAQACERLGKQELAAGQIDAGRRHLWHSARISRNANDNQEFERKLSIIANSNTPH